jgi:hypothetical protein
LSCSHNLTLLAGGQKEIADCDHDRRRALAALGRTLSPTSRNGGTPRHRIMLMQPFERETGSK